MQIDLKSTTTGIITKGAEGKLGNVGLPNSNAQDIQGDT
jgi:hypothetical protein